MRNNYVSLRMPKADVYKLLSRKFQSLIWLENIWPDVNSGLDGLEAKPNKAKEQSWPVVDVVNIFWQKS